MPPGPGGGRSRQPRSGLFQHNDVRRTPFVTRFLPQVFLSFPGQFRFPAARPHPPGPGHPPRRPGAPAARGGAGRAARISIQLGTPKAPPPPPAAWPLPRDGSRGAPGENPARSNAGVPPITTRRV